MTDSIVSAHAAARPDCQGLITAFLAGRNANTLRAYDRALRDFARFLGLQGVADAARILLRSASEANMVALSYQSGLRERGLSAASINARIAALRSLVKLGRLLGLATWDIEIQNVRSQPYRDTRGPGHEGYRRMLEATVGDTPQMRRDAAVLRLLYERGLRRAEVAGLDLADVDFAKSRVRIVGKGKTEAVWLSVPASTLEAIQAWVRHRGEQPGPLLTNLDALHTRGRLSTKGIYRIVVGAGRRAGVGHVRPHGLRHAAITRALDRTNGNLRAVARFARHSQLNTTALYDDARRDLGGEVARIIAEE